MGTEQDRVRQTLEDMARGRDIGHELRYNETTKKLRPASWFHDLDGEMEVTPEDFTFFSLKL